MKGFIAGLGVAAVMITAGVKTGTLTPPEPPTPTVAAAWDSQTVMNTVGYVALQHDSIKKNADSIRLETCRGGTLNASGTCSGRKLSPRTTKLYAWQMRIQHHSYRADSSLNQLMIRIVPPIPTPNVSYALREYTNSPNPWFAPDGADTVTVCAVVEGPAPSTQKRIAWPPVRFKYYGDNDSVTFALRGGNPLMQMCAKAAQIEGITEADSLTAPKVVWVGTRFEYNGRQLFRPRANIP